MKIGIMTDKIDYEKHLTGVNIYTRYLIENILKLRHNYEHEFFLIHYRKSQNPVYQERKEIIVPLLPLPPRSALTNIIRLPRYIRDIDVIHVPASALLRNSLFLVSGPKKVLTVHDLYMFFPELRTKYPYLNFKRWLSDTLWKPALLTIKTRVDMYIADSECTKRDMIKYMGLLDEKIRVVHLATDEKFRQINVNIPPYIGSSFILFITSKIFCSEIYSMLLEIYHSLRKKGIHKKLIIAGKIDKTLRRKIEGGITGESDLQKDVIITGYVSDENLVKLYNTADLFIRPSWYEGFGLPPLEAMACGCPVIASNAGSLPEIIGNAGILVDPYNENEWVNAIYGVLTNNSLRHTLIKQGLKRAKKFSWEKTAKETIKVYEEVFMSTRDH